jgi:hypothetical protein
MTIEEVAKQIDELKESILRLCSHADSPDVVLNALMASLVEHAKKDRLPPNNLLTMIAYYITYNS